MSKRYRISAIRIAERAKVKAFNVPNCYFPNPDASPLFDRHAPIPSADKAYAFGMEPTEPKRLFELPKGDAGAGQTVYRKIHAYFEAAGTDSRVGSRPYSTPLPIATMRSTDLRPKYFHVSVYGYGVRRSALPGAPLLPPLTDGEAVSFQFESIFFQTGVGVFTELTPRFVPSVSTAQARVMVFDESGQRFFDVDVIGNRSFSVYGFGATVFLLVKDGGYEVDAQNPAANASFTGNSAGVEDDFVGARVVPIFSNRTESIENRTITANIDPSVTGISPVITPIPPGARRVQIFSHDPAPAADWRLQFWFGRSDFTTSRPDLGTIDWEAGQSKTGIIEIPNAPSVAITSLNPAITPTTQFSLVYEVEP